MPQQTNLNIAPYFDDFDTADGFHKVLFKPGYPVQARELTSLQSILSNQIERFGQSVFKEGAKVIPGNTSYTQLLSCIKLSNTYQNVPVSAYANQIIGSVITGQASGVSATVTDILYPQESEDGELTLYIRIDSSSSIDNSTSEFSDGELLSSNVSITSGLLGNSTISAGSPFALTATSASSGQGSAFHIENGIYFVRGQFIEVFDETLILDQYSSSPSYRVGLYINEEIINANLDDGLNDNSQGFNNYAAPGADRLRITVSLFKKSLDDFDDDNFIELAKIQDGTLVGPNNANGNKASGGGGDGGVYFKDLNDVLARRTYDESGNYAITPFDVVVVESLNDNIGNQGIFQPGSFTYNGSSASSNLALYKVSPGKAYVKGYELETTEPIFIDASKPRTANKLEDQLITYNTGSTFKLNNVRRSPQVGIGNTYIVSLRNQRKGDNEEHAAGTEIGLARVYDFKLNSQNYLTNQDLNLWGISLYDVKTYTDITLNQAVTLAVPTFIKGASSGASAFLRSAVSSGVALTVYERNGNFIENENLIFDGITDGRIAIAITEHSIGDVKSIISNELGIPFTAAPNAAVGITTFSADILQSVGNVIGISTITTGGVIRSNNPNFLNGIKVGSILSYDDVRFSDPNYLKVTVVGTDSVTTAVVGIVTGINNSVMPAAQIATTDLTLLATKLDSSSDNTLYTSFPKSNIANVDLTDSLLPIRKIYDVTIVNNAISSGTPVQAGDNESFAAFNGTNYSLTRGDGSVEILLGSSINISADGKTFNAYNLTTDNAACKLIATLIKSKPVSKVKIKNRVKSVIINKSTLAGSGIGATTINDGLDFGNYPYGTRVQDEDICLNTSDIIEIHGIYESKNTTDPSAPHMTLNSINSASGTTSEIIVGERIKGELTNAIAIVISKPASNKISYIYLNDNTFDESELITATESNITAIITDLTGSHTDISSNFTFTTGQEKTFYDFGTLKRNIDTQPPSKKIIVYFSAGSHDSSDTGDVTTIESYKDYNYSEEIPSIDGIPNSDIIDIRPRVSDYSVVADTRSPLEFLGRSMSGSGNSAANILASNQNIILDYGYYQGRVDTIYLTETGNFQVKFGDPSDNPEKPVLVDNAIEISTVTLPPYLYDVDQANLTFPENKRYQMKDIQNLEERIDSLEYYVGLSALESTTANMFVSDSDGSNRFKSGFFVDNFTSFNSQDDALNIRNSIDIKTKELRPKHYTTLVGTDFGPVTVDTSNDDKLYPVNTPTNINCAIKGEVITLSYTEVDWLDQPFETRLQQVNGNPAAYSTGILKLTPSSDNWVDNLQIKTRVFADSGSFAQTVKKVTDDEVDSQNGYIPIIWNSWQSFWTGETSKHKSGVNDRTVRRHSNSTMNDVKANASMSALRTVGSQFVSDSINKFSIGDRIINRDLIGYMRKRNIMFSASGMRDTTRLYPFFDGVDISYYCTPKLLGITMESGSGTFEIGEIVTGTVVKNNLDEYVGQEAPFIRFRLASPSHRDGAYDSNNPSKSYTTTPYGIPPTAYTPSSSYLNIDLYSMTKGYRFQGYAVNGMVLVGETSGAVATVSDKELVTSETYIQGTICIPDPRKKNNPKFESGTKLFTLIDEPSNNRDFSHTVAEDQFSVYGKLDNVKTNTISLRNPKIAYKQEFDSSTYSKALGTSYIRVRTLGGSQEKIGGWTNPLAQTFTVSERSGIFLTRCNLFFGTVDANIPITFQLRTVENGVPSQKVIPFSEVILGPNETTTGGNVTPVRFDSPVYLEGSGKEYAITLSTNSGNYTVPISRYGEPSTSGRAVSNSPNLGSLFKPSNAGAWESSKLEELKFKIIRADFELSGSIDLYNPDTTGASNNKVGNSLLPVLPANPLNIISKSVRVGFGTTVADSNYRIGNTVSQLNTQATGNLAGVAGSLTSLTITNAGLGFTPAAANYTFDGVTLTTITGKGGSATANITITNGSIAGVATIANGGSGYQAGDVLGVSQIGTLDIGRDVKLTVASIGGTSEFILDQVQGNFATGTGSTIYYTSGVSGIGLTELNASNGGNVPAAIVTNITDGLYIKVNHKNHGMYFSDNIVDISDVKTDIKPTKLSTSYSGTGGITVEDATDFETFENVGVAATNVGFIQVGSEIISYTSVGSNILGGTVTRGVFSTNTRSSSYPAGTPVFKYELGGVNLGRINKSHDLNSVLLDNAISYDSYHIKIDTSTLLDSNNVSRATSAGGYPELYLNETKSTGGYNVRATQNIPFEVLTPVIENITVPGTTLKAQVRTVSGQSMDGSEIPFIDMGYQYVTINENNYFNSTRLICSKPNESSKLATLPGSKSVHMKLLLNTMDSKVSPMIDSQRLSFMTTSNRVNSPITDYANDYRVNTLKEDPTACQYISKEVTLENSATSIKVLLNAYINTSCDIRVFYAISDKSDFKPIFTPFPGYSNLNDMGNIIDSSDNDGHSDIKIDKSLLSSVEGSGLDYKEYEFNIDDLPSFRAYKIKIVMTSSNQVHIPRVKDLRVLALA